MNAITLYLAKFKTILTSDDSIRRIVAESIKEVVGVDVNEKHITMREQTATIRVSPALRSTLFISRNKITELVGKRANLAITVR